MTIDPIAEFSDNVRWLHEVDYGDFKRKVGLYANRLNEKLTAEQRPKVKDLLERLKQEILYGSIGEVEHARTQALIIAEIMQERIQLN